MTVMTDYREATYVFVTSESGPRLGRVDRRLLKVMRALIAEDIDVELVCVPGSAAETRALELSIPVSKTQISSYNVLVTRSRLRDYLRRQRPNVAHSTGWLADWSLRSAAPESPRTVIVNSCDCLDWPSQPSGLLARWRRRLMRSNIERADAVIVDCEQLADELSAAGVQPERLFFDAPSVDVERVMAEAAAGLTTPLPGHAPHVGYAGALLPSRGLAVLAQAAAILDMRRASATVIVAGSGPGTPDLRDEVEARRLYLVADPPSIPPVLAALDVCVFPTLEPGTPTTLLEAAVLGRPIVATAVSGISDLFVDGRQIALVPPDDPKALAAAIARLLDEPALAAEMAARAQRHTLEHLSSAASIERHRTLYEQLLGGYAPGAEEPLPASDR